MVTNEGDDTQRDGVLYFIQCGDERGPVKIGIATDLGKRLSMLQVGCPYPLHVLAAVKFQHGRDPGCLHYMEAFLHRELRPVRVRGEWFQGPTTVRCLARIMKVIRDSEHDYEIAVDYLGPEKPAEAKWPEGSFTWRGRTRSP